MLMHSARVRLTQTHALVGLSGAHCCSNTQWESRVRAEMPGSMPRNTHTRKEYLARYTHARITWQDIDKEGTPAATWWMVNPKWLAVLMCLPLNAPCRRALKSPPDRHTKESVHDRSCIRKKLTARRSTPRREGCKCGCNGMQGGNLASASVSASESKLVHRHIRTSYPTHTPHTLCQRSRISMTEVDAFVLLATLKIQPRVSLDPVTPYLAKSWECVCACVYICVRCECICINKHIYKYIYIHKYIYICVYLYIYTNMYIICSCKYIYAYVHKCQQINVYMHMYISVQK